MKQVVLRIDDAAFEKFMGMVSLCPMVEVLNVCDMNESVVKGLPFFYTPKDFIDYMREAEFDGLPGRSTVYNTIAKVRGKYPDWTFTDAPKASEALRRKNLIKQFLSAFMRAQSRKLDGLLDEF